MQINIKVIILFVFTFFSTSIFAGHHEDSDTSSEDSFAEVFTEKDLISMKNFAEALHKLTTPDDVILFVGRSPWIVKHYFDIKNFDRTYFSMAFSVKSNIVDPLKNSPQVKFTDTALDNYRDYSERLEIGKTLDEKKGSIIFVDFILSGAGLVNFSTLFSNIYSDKIEGRTLKFCYGSVYYAFEDLQESILNPVEKLVNKFMKNPQGFSIKNTVEYYPYSFIYNVNEMLDRDFPNLRSTNPDKKKRELEKAYLTCEDDDYCKRWVKFYADSAKEDNSDEYVYDLDRKFGNWEFSLPGLCFFPVECWDTLDPLLSDKSGNIDEVMTYAETIWSK